MEKETLVQVFEVRRYCDECKEGEMEQIDGILQTVDLLYYQFPYKCNKCGHEAGLAKSYPYLRYKSALAENEEVQE
jgi:hypothetical protein